jgi:hypothetical protein
VSAGAGTAQPGVLVADGLQGHVLGDLLGRPHLLEPDLPALRGGGGAELLVAGEEVDLRLVAAHPIGQDRLLGLGDGDEVEVAPTVLVDLGDPLELAERDPIGHRLGGRGDAGVRRGLDHHDVRVRRVGDLLVGDQAGGEERGDGDDDQRGEPEPGQGHRPPTVAAPGRARRAGWSRGEGG